MMKPTQTELEILQILWQEKAATVRTINELQNKHKEVGYTTTLKIMQIMFEKGLLNRKPNGRSHIYSAALKQETTQKDLLGRFVNTAFGGNAMNLVMQVLGNHKASKQELEEIKELINKIENQKS